MESANQNPLTADQLPIYAYKRDIIEMVSDNLVPFPLVFSRLIPF